LGAVSARAGSLIVLDLAAQTGSPGDTLVFEGILSNSGLDTLFLNSVQFSLAGNAFTPNFTDPFINNVPISLSPGESTSLIELFNVLLNDPFTDPPGTYDGTYALLGGIDDTAQIVVGSADFTVTVNAASAVPEPSLLPVLAGGLACLIALRRRNSAG
jgi:hypothetical protein